MPIDFLDDAMPSAGASMPQAGPRDFLTESDTPQESLGTSLTMAIPRVGTDLATGIYHLAQNVPGYLKQAQTEVPGLVKNAYAHPAHMRSQALAGLAEMGQNVFNAPHDFINYLTNRLNLFPQDLNQKVQMGRMPDDTQGMINQTFGVPEYEGERLARGLTRNALNLGMAKGALSSVKPQGLLTTKKSLVNNILDTHDVLDNRASKGFKTVSDEVNKRGITQVPVNSGFIDSLSEYFPKTKQANQLLQSASTGDYNSLRKLQSDLYTNAKKNLQSSTEVDRMRGEEMLEKRNDVNDAISQHLKNTGNHDLYETLNAARNDYRTLQDVYYNRNMSNALVKMVDPDIRKIPANIGKILSEDSKPMQALRDFHAGLEGDLQRYLFKSSAKNALKKVFSPTNVALGGLGGAALYGARRNQ